MREFLPLLEEIHTRLERGPGQAFMDLPFELRVTEKDGEKKKPHGPSAPKDIQKTIARYYDDVMASLPKHLKGASKKRQKAYAAAVAWTRFCKHKDPGHPSCNRKECAQARATVLRERIAAWSSG